MSNDLFEAYECLILSYQLWSPREHIPRWTFSTLVSNAYLSNLFLSYGSTPAQLK